MIMVLDNGDNAGKRDVACPFTQAVHGSMDAADTGPDGGEYIGRGKIIIVVCMKVKGQLRVPVDDGLAEIICFYRIEYSQRIGQDHARYWQGVPANDFFSYVEPV